MELTLERTYKNCKRADGTVYCIGRLYVDNVFLCNTIEDEDRGLKQSMSESEIKKTKVYGLTAIPTGRYKIYISYSPKFKKRMPYLSSIPGYTGVMIHTGNTEKDSLGCIIVGKNTVKGALTESKKTMEKLMSMLERADKYDSPIYLTIK